MDARCQCGAVQFKTPIPKPLALYICHCSECRRQSSSAFGTSAIFPRFNLPQAELLSCYSRPTPSGHTLFCYFCRQCGTRLLHSSPGKAVVSVKGGCLEGLDWKTAIHIWTKSAMVPIPEGVESHSGEPCASEFSSSQDALDQPSDPPGLFTGGGGSSSEGEEAHLAKGRMTGACELSGVL